MPQQKQGFRPWGNELMASSVKFGRNYRLTISPAPGDTGDDIIVTMPFTIQFEIQRAAQSSLNYANIEIYNLAPKTRDRIFSGLEHRPSVSA